MNTSKCSDGTRINTEARDRRISQAKAEFLEERRDNGGTYLCQATGNNVFGQHIDCSHIISVDRCCKMGKTELSWDINNLQLECRTEHEIWEGGPIEKKMDQKNFQDKMDYIKIHDPQRFATLTIAIDSVNGFKEF